jgi:hypothetical protein
MEKKSPDGEINVYFCLQMWYDIIVGGDGNPTPAELGPKGKK